MNIATAYKKLVYDHEVLKARLGMRDHYHALLVRDIYENIGQLLCLVRIRLNEEPALQGQVESPAAGELLEEAIDELRQLSKVFNSKVQEDSGNNIIQAIETELQLLKLDQSIPITVSGEMRPISAPHQLLFLSIIQKLLYSIQHENPGLIPELTLQFYEAFLVLKMNYPGSTNNFSILQAIDIPTTIELMGGVYRINCIHDSVIEIIISIPFQSQYYGEDNKSLPGR